MSKTWSTLDRDSLLDKGNQMYMQKGKDVYLHVIAEDLPPSVVGMDSEKFTEVFLVLLAL